MKETKVKKKLKNQKAITLIALVITIIVLLILAGVSIATLTGENGILTQAENAMIEDSHASVREGILLAYGEYQIEQRKLQSSEGEIKEVTKIASLELATTNNTSAEQETFIEFLTRKNYIKADTDGIIDTEALLGKKLKLGNGTENSDVYKIEEDEEYYTLYYYDEDTTIEKISLTQIAKIGSSNVENEAVIAPETYEYSFNAGYTGSTPSDDIIAYVVENGEESDGTTTYDMIFVGSGDMADITDWDTEILDDISDTPYGVMTGQGYNIKIKNVKISEGITSIGLAAFYNCNKLTSIEIPSGVTSIEFYAFNACNSLRSITILSEITSIDMCAFYGCSSLTSISIPSSIRYIASNAFSGCSVNITIDKEENSISGSPWGTTGTVTWKEETAEQ